MNSQQHTPTRKTYLSLMRRRGESIRVDDDIKIVVRGLDGTTGEVILEIHVPDHLQVTAPPEPEEQPKVEPARHIRPASTLPKLPPSGRPTLSMKRKGEQA